MKSLILLITFIVSFGLTSLVVAAHPSITPTINSPILGMEPPTAQEPSQSDLNEQLSDLICKSVGANGIVAKRKKNEGISYEVAIAQFTELVEANDDKSAPAQVAHAMSSSVIKSIYDAEIDASTDEEITSLGVAIYNHCRTIADKIRWDTEVK